MKISEYTGNIKRVILLTALAAACAVPYLLFTGNYLFCALLTVNAFCVLAALQFGYKYYSKTIQLVSILAESNFKAEAAIAVCNKKNEEQNFELKRYKEDLEQLGYILSHDLKAPARNISSFMGLLSKQFNDAAPKGSKEFVDMAKQSADQLTRQIDDLLIYCRVDRNLPLPAPVNINEVITTIRMELNQKLKEKNAEIIVERELPVLADVHSNMIYKVFQHLIANAVKFNTGKPEVRINFKEENGLLTFSISDNGIGIDPAYKSKLFQLFKRLHSADQYEGTGIGLAICKKIIGFYRGDIWFESEPGKGTTFLFTLKKSVAEIPAPLQTDIPLAPAISKAA